MKEEHAWNGLITTTAGLLLGCIGTATLVAVSFPCWPGNEGEAALTASDWLQFSGTLIAVVAAIGAAATAWLAAARQMAQQRDAFEITTLINTLDRIEQRRAATQRFKVFLEGQKEKVEFFKIISAYEGEFLLNTVNDKRNKGRGFSIIREESIGVPEHLVAFVEGVFADLQGGILDTRPTRDDPHLPGPEVEKAFKLKLNTALQYCDEEIKTASRQLQRVSDHMLSLARQPPAAQH